MNKTWTHYITNYVFITENLVIGVHRMTFKLQQYKKRKYMIIIRTFGLETGQQRPLVRNCFN